MGAHAAAEAFRSSHSVIVLTLVSIGFKVAVGLLLLLVGVELLLPEC